MREVYKHFIIQAPLLTHGWRAIGEITVTDTRTHQEIILACSVDIANNVEARKGVFISGKRHYIYDDYLVVFTGCHLVCWKFGDTLESWHEIYQQEFEDFRNTDAFILFQEKIYIAHGENIICFDPVTITINSYPIPTICVPVYTKRMPFVMLKHYQNQILVDRYYRDDPEDMIHDMVKPIGSWLASQVIRNPKPLDILAGRLLKKINQYLAGIPREFPHITMQNLLKTDLMAMLQHGTDKVPIVKPFQATAPFRITYDRMPAFHSVWVISNNSQIGGLRWYYNENAILVMKADGFCAGAICPRQIGIPKMEGQYFFMEKYSNNIVPKIIECVVKSYCCDYMQCIMPHVRSRVLPDKLDVDTFYLFDGHDFNVTEQPEPEIYY